MSWVVLVIKSLFTHKWDKMEYWGISQNNLGRSLWVGEFFSFISEFLYLFGMQEILFLIFVIWTKEIFDI